MLFFNYNKRPRADNYNFEFPVSWDVAVTCKKWHICCSGSISDCLTLPRVSLLSWWICKPREHQKLRDQWPGGLLPPAGLDLEWESPPKKTINGISPANKIYTSCQACLHWPSWMKSCNHCNHANHAMLLLQCRINKWMLQALHALHAGNVTLSVSVSVFQFNPRQIQSLPKRFIMSPAKEVNLPSIVSKEIIPGGRTGGQNDVGCSGQFGDVLGLDEKKLMGHLNGSTGSLKGISLIEVVPKCSYTLTPPRLFKPTLNERLSTWSLFRPFPVIEVISDVQVTLWKPAGKPKVKS